MGISLEVTGLSQLKNKIDKLAKDFPNKMEMFLENLMRAGIPVIDENIGIGEGDSSTTHSTSVVVNRDKDTIVATLYVNGVDIAFLEFGAGIYYHTADHPKASELGMGVGTYPGQTHAYDEFWWYRDEQGVAHYSQGTEMTMPVYLAGQEIIAKFGEIARETFGV